MKGIERAEIMGDWYSDLASELAEAERVEAFQDETNAQPIGPDTCWECGHQVREGRCKCSGQHWS